LSTAQRRAAKLVSVGLAFALAACLTVVERFIHPPSLPGQMRTKKRAKSKKKTSKKAGAKTTGRFACF
jgi:hypothetical protein